MASVGDGIDAASGGWTFGGDTPRAFDDHVARSIPWYEACHELVVDLADQLVPAGGRCYELGCSTGALTAKLAARLQPRQAEVIGVDSEPGMIALAAERCAELPLARFETVAVEDLELEPADLVISYYTLQFVRRRYRRSVVRRIHLALEPAGALILFEKVLATTAAAQQIATDVYHDWKQHQGFSEAEIAAKDRSLRGVLEPQTSAQNEAMLRVAGFAAPTPVFRWLNWEGLLVRTESD